VTGLLTAHGPRSAPAAPERREKALVISVAPFRVGAGRPAIDAQSFDRELRRHLAEVQPRRIRVADPRSPADLRVDATLLSTKEGLRVDARILEGNSARQIWSDTFHRAPGDADDFPLEVALRVTRAVVARYVPPGRHEPFVRTAVSAPALELYRKGRAIRSQPEPQRDLDRALKLFEQALALEPRFAEAWSAIGDVWAERALLWRGQSQGASVSQARNALNRALALDPRNAEALNDLGLLLLQYDRSFAEAEPYLRSATVADPEYIDAHFNLSLLLTALGQTDGAVSAFRRAQQLDPESHYPSQFLAFVYLLGNRNDEAAVQYRAARLLLRRPESMDWALMWTAIGSRRWNDATRHLSGLLGRPVKIPAGVDDPATFFRKELRRFEQELLERERVGRIDPYSLACFYAEVGNADRAFAALNRAADVRSPNLIFTAVDPRLEPLRRDVRYYPILQRLGLRR
jgi:tetratricopeptide (TPR) repeat protein